MAAVQLTEPAAARWLNMQLVSAASRLRNLQHYKRCNLITHESSLIKNTR
jgi:hypothetical protein